MRLYITEKKDQVKKIAEVFKLHFDYKENVAKGKINGIDVVVAPLAGHIMRPLKPEEYEPVLKTMDWTAVVEKGYFPFIPKQFKKKVKTKEEGKQIIKEGNKVKVIYTDYPKYFKIIKKYIKQADEIVAAPDPDREGMALFKEVVDYVGAMRKVIGYIRLNKLEKKAVFKAVNDLRKDRHYLVLADSGEARGEYDWLFGMNLTVAATVFLSKNNMTLHVGAVKTPTLRMVVERDKEIEEFKPETFYSIKFLVEKEGKKFYVTTDIKDKDKNEVTELKKYLEKNVKELIVSDYKKEKKKKSPPLPYTLTELASTVEKKYKIPIDKTIKIAQKLYENEYQTYPRSDCNYYSTELWEEAPQIIKNLFENNPEYKKFESIINTSLKRPSFNDKEVDKKSHTALAPTGKYPKNIDDVSFKVYDTVVRRFLIQFAPDMEYYSVRGKVKFKDHKGKERTGSFSATSIIDEGFIKIEKPLSDEEKEKDKEPNIPPLKIGDKLKVLKVEMTSTTTRPKPRFTESTLLDAMEKIHRFYDDPLIKEKLKDIGIGTQATRVGIIISLLEEGYLKKEKGKIVSTPKGREIIKYLPEDVSSPVLRAKLEADLEAILDGRLTRKGFLQKNKNIVFDLFEKIKEKGKTSTIDKKPTPKQIKYAKELAKRAGVEYTAEMEASFQKTKEFIEKYKNILTDYQRKIISENAPQEIKELLKEESKNYEKLKEWYMQYMSSKTYSLTDKQKSIIENSDLSDNIKELAKKDSLTKEEYMKLSKAIGQIMNKNKKTRRKTRKKK